QIGVIDLEELAQFAEPGDVEQLAQLQEQIQEYLKQMREQQGIEESGRGYQLTPKAYRLFQSKLLTRIFEQLQESRSGRHQGPMGRGGLYINVKRMGLALDGLIRTEYPGDFLQFIEMYTFARPRHVSEVAAMMPKPITVYDYVVRLKADMSDPNISELHIPPH